MAEFKAIISRSSKGAKHRVFHKEGCPYANRIQSRYRQVRDVRTLTGETWHECSYCGGLRGYDRTFKKRPSRYGKERKLGCFYDNETDALFLTTDVGCWKVVHLADSGYFMLFHKNYYERGMKRSELVHGNYHRQKDCKKSHSLDPIEDYILSHDKAKRIMSQNDGDYTKLPNKTKRDKHYYQKERRKAKNAGMKRMKALFEQIHTELQTI